MGAEFCHLKLAKFVEKLKPKWALNVQKQRKWLTSEKHHQMIIVWKSSQTNIYFISYDFLNAE